MTLASREDHRSALALEAAAAALRSGDAPEAEQVLRMRLLQDGADSACLARLADIVSAQGGSDEAILLLRRATQAAPEAHDIRFSLVRLLQSAKELEKALTEVGRFPLAVRSQFEVRACEAALLGSLGRHEEELALYRLLLRDRPRDADLWKSYGNALVTAGQAEEAISALRRAIKVRPDFGDAWWSLANLKRVRFEGSDLAAMRKALRSNISPVDALHIHFALGKALEDRRAFDQSFAHYDAGNRIRAAQLSAEEQSVTRFVEAMFHSTREPLFSALAGAGHPSREPIFVVGLQRSGSTLLEQILASHSHIEGTSELVAIPQMFDRLMAEAGGPVRDLLLALNHLTPARCEQLGAEYLERARPFRLSGKPMFVDKLPANWMYVGFIRLILPNARIIDSRRHPMACGFSNFKQHYATGVGFAYSQQSIGRFYCDYLRLMRHFDQLLPGAVHHVINERLIDDPEGETRRMLDYVGVPFEASCLEFHRSGRAVRTPSAEQVRRPINREGVDQWRNYEPWLGPLKEALGTALEGWDRTP